MTPVLRVVTHPWGIVAYPNAELDGGPGVGTLVKGELLIVLAAEDKWVVRVLSPRLGIVWVRAAAVGGWTVRLSKP
jgi:hypothetical protein